MRGWFAAATIVAAALHTGVPPSAVGAQPRQPAAPNTLAAIVERPLALRDGIGRAHEAITTSSKTAQAFYDQGLAYLHSFVWIEAARSFNEALRADDRVALAYVGLSYALAELGDADGARAASARAQALKESLSARERVRLDLRTLQLRASAAADAGAATASGRSWRPRSARDPTDVELLLLVGRAQDPSHDAHGMDAGSASLGFYERALAQAPDYFATHHYLAHAYENIGRPDRALEHAAAFARLAPSIPHAQHMHGHVLRRVGRMDEAIAAFRKADELGSAYLASERIPAEYDWHYRHNLDLLGTAYQYLGQIRSAQTVLERAFDMPATSRLNDELNRREWPQFLLARGRAKEAHAAAATLSAHALPLVRALGDILASRALAALRRPEEAAEAGNRGLQQMRSGTIGGVLVPDFRSGRVSTLCGRG